MKIVTKLLLNVWTVLGLIVVLICIMGWWLGVLNYTPEFKTFIGIFTPKNQASVVKLESDSSNVLPNSIYSVADDLYSMQGTSLERQKRFEDYKGFLTKNTKGKILDIGTDGKTVLIGGFDNEKNAILLCLFQDKWAQHIKIMKIEEDLIFRGTISHFDPSHMRVELGDCELRDDRN